MQWMILNHQGFIYLKTMDLLQLPFVVTLYVVILSINGITFDTGTFIISLWFRIISYRFIGYDLNLLLVI